MSRVAAWMCLGLVVVATGGCRGWEALRGGAASEHPENAAEAAAEPARSEAVVVTVRVVRERRELPEALESREVEYATSAPIRVERIAGQLADLLDVDVVVEERPARDGERVELGDPGPLAVVSRGTARDLLNEVATAAGYEWEYDDLVLEPRIVFYRYRDAAWRAAHRPAGAEAGQLWRMDPGRHETLRQVLEEWGRGAGWTVVWEAEGLDYAVTAAATFHGTFEEAVDALLRDTRGYRTLIPTAWRANRYLTVKAGG